MLQPINANKDTRVEPSFEYRFLYFKVLCFYTSQAQLKTTAKQPAVSTCLITLYYNFIKYIFLDFLKKILLLMDRLANKISLD